LGEINSSYDPDVAPQPMNLTDDQRVLWDKIVQRISREVGPVTSEEYLYSLTLWRDGPAGHLQLDYEGDSASIYIPYCYPGQAALPIMAEAYHIARILEEESNLEGYDGQAEQSVRAGDIKHSGGQAWRRLQLGAGPPHLIALAARALAPWPDRANIA
jgi:hypothetical protein